MSDRLMNIRKAWSARWLASAAMCIALTATAAYAGSRDDDEGPGYVDGSAFAELASDDATLVEISIGRTLLKPLSKGLAKKDENLGRLLSDLRSIQVVVVEVDDSDAKHAGEMMTEMAKRLRRDGWDTLARIREKNENVNVMVMTDAGAIDGLTVMVTSVDGGGGEIVFVNIAGRLDLELIGELGTGLGVGGLGVLGEIDWEEFEDVGFGESKFKKKEKTR